MRRTGRAGALLLVAHLVAGVILSAVHASHGFERVPDHIEASGTHHPEHGSACVLCRFADSRFVGAVEESGLRIADPSATDSPPLPGAPLPGRPDGLPVDARAPPHLSPAA